MTDPARVIAIDGPGGAGKGTVCRRIALSLGFHLLDSGALYRVLAFAARARGIALDDERALSELAGSMALEFVAGDEVEPVRPMLDGEDVTASIRTELCGADASKVAALPAVRQAFLTLQHRFRRSPGLVADGRDMGTVVFPDAPLKVFLTASVEERAQRRHKQLIGKGIGVSLTDLRGEIAARDRRDMERAVAPLKPADDAIVMDTTAMDIDSVVTVVLTAAAERGLTDGI